MLEPLFKIFFVLLLIIVVHKKLDKLYKREPVDLLDKMNVKEYISSNPSDSELYSVNEDEKAWSNDYITQHPKYHSAKVSGEKTNIGKFFDVKNGNKYNDTTSPKSKSNIPDRCIKKDNEIYCNFNNKIQNIPPKLIEDPKGNLALNMIGDDGDIKTNKYDKIEKVSTGGEYFEGVSGYSPLSSSNLLLKEIDDKNLNKYSL